MTPSATPGPRPGRQRSLPRGDLRDRAACRHLNPDGHALGGYRAKLLRLVQTTQATDDLAAFSRRLWLLTRSRSDDAHTGASARRIAAEAVEVALVFEAALRAPPPPEDAMSNAPKRKPSLPPQPEAAHIVAADVMVAGPVCAAGWHTLADVRTALLAHAFTALPYLHPKAGGRKGCWYLLTDAWVAERLITGAKKDRSTSVADAIEKNEARAPPKAGPPLRPNQPVLTTAVAQRFREEALLLVVDEARPEHLVGVISAADLL